MNFKRRIEVLTERIVDLAPPFDEEPASVRWLAVLKLARPGIERQPRSTERDVLLGRIDDSIAMIEDYRERFAASTPWVYLEYFCHVCVLRLNWTTPGWQGRELAVVDEDYGEHMRQIEQIERGRLKRASAVRN